jgi:hypothetical protein
MLTVPCLGMSAAVLVTAAGLVDSAAEVDGDGTAAARNRGKSGHCFSFMVFFWGANFNQCLEIKSRRRDEAAAARVSQMGRLPIA